MKKSADTICFWAALFLLICSACGKGCTDRTKTVCSDAVFSDLGEPSIALTFDDGPTIYTEILLEGLKERQVTASFFLLGRNIEGKESVVKRMYEEGHIIGNHTYNHVRLSQIPEKEAEEEINRTNALIEEITGESPVFVRPPYGDWRTELEYQVKMLPVFWTVDPLDWETDDGELVVKRVEKEIENGDIILLHDCSESSVEAALKIVDDLKKKGFTFVTAEEMILE